MAEKPQYTVMAGRSFISEMPQGGLKIRNQDTGQEYRIEDAMQEAESIIDDFRGLSFGG